MLSEADLVKSAYARLRLLGLPVGLEVPCLGRYIDLVFIVGRPPEIARGEDVSIDKRILHLTIKRHWFAEIASGRKTVEYRECTLYWDRRIFKKHSCQPRDFDEVHFRNGYRRNSPFMRIICEAIDIEKYNIPPTPCYAIYLGKILEIRNWNP